MAHDMHPPSHSSSWNNEPIFSSFWKHYQQQTEWMRSRGVTPVPVRFPEQAESGDLTVDAESHADNDTEYSLPDDTDDYELTEEYLDFIAITRQHQKDYKKVKAQRMREERSTVYTDISTLAAPVTAEDQDVRRNSREKLMRRMQLTQWYGEAAGQEIGAIEDQMDKDFDDYVSKHNPSFFPACPIVMKGYFDNN